MDLLELKTYYFLFDPTTFGRISVLVDFGNVRPWAKELWPEENRLKFNVEIDINKIHDLCVWVKASQKLFYYGFFARDYKLSIGVNDKKHNDSIFRIDKARRSGFKVVTKEIKMVPHFDENGKFIGKFPKCNFDVEITMDLLLKINDFDTVVLFSGDSDFSGLLKYLKSLNKKVIIICTRSRMSKELEEVADKFVPAETLSSFLKYNRKTTLRP